MRLFGSSGSKSGWMCVNVTPHRVDVSRVETAGRARPEIVVCDSYRKEGNDVATLKRLRRELRLHRYRCTTLLKSGDYQILQVDAPNVPAQEARSAVRWCVKDLIDYPVDTATVDAVYIPTAGNGTGRDSETPAGAPAGLAGALFARTARTPQMFAVAARNETIAAAVQPFHDADIPLEVIDIPELAQRNVAQCFEEPGRGLALLAFDHNGGLLTFTYGGELYQYRRIDISAGHFSGAAREQRQAFYERAVLELQRSLDHFDRQYQYRQIAIARVVVTLVPGAEDLKDYVAANLDVPVTVLDLSHAFDFPHVPELREPVRQAQCLQAIGAALRAEGAPA